MQSVLFCIRKHYLKIIVILMVVVVSAAWLTAPPVVLIVQNNNTGEILLKKGMDIEEKFTLEYTHSITKQPVKEIYYVKDKKTIALKEMQYDSFGSNLPVGSEKLAGETTNFFVEDGYYKITYPSRTFDRIPLRTGKVIADHMLLFQDGAELRLLDVTSGGTYVDIYVEPFFFKNFQLFS